MPRLVRGKVSANSTDQVYSSADIRMRAQPHVWDPQACHNCASALIDHIRSVAKQAPSPAVWRIDWSSASREIEMRRLSIEETQAEIGSDPGRAGILPSEHVEFIKSKISV